MKTKPLAAAAVLFAIAAAVYVNTLSNGFVVDDLHQIVDNDWITGPRHLGTIFTHGVWEFEGKASSYYRPLMYVLYMAVYAVAGRAAWAYHLLNVVFHAAATLLVAALGRQVFRRRVARSTFAEPAFVAGLLFAVHPIHTEAVAWSAGIADLGLTVFGLSAVWLHATAATRGWRRDAAAAAAWLLALLCKETAVVVPVLAAAYDLTLVEPERRRKRLLSGLMAFAPAAAVYVGLRVHALGGLMPTVEGTGLSSSAYALAVLALFGGYLEKLVLPAGLNFWHAFTPPASITSAEALRFAAIVAVATAGAIAASAHRSAVFAGALIVLPLLPTFNLAALNQGLENAFAERYLYLPSAGFVLLAALGIDALRVRGWLRPMASAGLVVLLGASCGSATIARNRVWKDQLTLWSDAVGKSPHSAIAHMNYGAALIYAGRQSEGTAEMHRAAAMDPRLVERQLVLGATYLEKGLRTKAVLALYTALALDPNCAQAHYNLGIVYESQDQIAAAIGEYESAVRANPAYADAHNNLGILLAQASRLDEAIAHFQAAVRARPDDPELRLNLTRAYLLKGSSTEAAVPDAVAPAGAHPAR